MRIQNSRACSRTVGRVLVPLLVCIGASVAQAALDGVATFESIGVTWSPPGGSASNIANVRYCVVVNSGCPNWDNNGLDGYPLWFDGGDGEYRGSIVQLAPATTYEIRLTLAQGGFTETTQVTTWSESFPISQTITLAASSSETLVITQGGSPSGYVLYTPASGSEAVIDVNRNANYNIDVRASYIIIRGLTLRGAATNGIHFSQDVTNVVIEDNDISDWSSPISSGSNFGTNFGSGIRGKDLNLQRIVIQRNDVHHPAYDTKSWCEGFDGSQLGSCNSHSEGPNAIRFTNALRNSVIRYNTIRSDDDHYFNDCLGGEGGTEVGFPGPNSDLYGNYIERCWDNTIEAEYGNKNTRIWGNFMEHSYRHMAIAPAGDGPMYIWRNVINQGRKGPFDTPENRMSAFVKFGRDSTGRVYLFHNTMLQTNASGPTIGIGNGASGSDGDNLVSRNNILHVRNDSDTSVDTGGDNDYNYDLFNGSATQEADGINQAPSYDGGNGPFEHFLQASTPGHDDGVVIPNFNYGFGGSAPDMGAFELGDAPLEFGKDAYDGGAPPDEPPPPVTGVTVH